MTGQGRVDVEWLQHQLHIAAQKGRPLVYCNGRCGFRVFMSLAGMRTRVDIEAAYRERGHCRRCGAGVNLSVPRNVLRLPHSSQIPTAETNAPPMPFGYEGLRDRVRGEATIARSIP